MKKRIDLRIVILVFLFPLILSAQNYAGFRHDNYSGLHGVISNPALVVGSPIRSEFNLFSVGAYVNNDYKSVEISKIIDGDTDDLIDFSEENVSADSSNNFNLNASVLLPSFMFNINENSAIALVNRARVFANISDIDGNLYDRFENGFEDNTDYSFSIPESAITSHVWAEFGLVYGHLLKVSDKMKLKTGIGVKYLQGVGSAHASFQNFDADYFASTNTLNTSGEITYGTSLDFEAVDDGFKLAKGSRGFGFDLGAVLLLGGGVSTEETKPKNYDYRIGVSITDIGAVSYSDATQTKYNVNQNDIDENSLEGDDFESVLESIYPGQSSQEKLTVKLPTAAHINIDWNINNSFYANINADLALSKKGDNTNSIVSNYTFTPRFEKKWLSAYSPINYDSFGNFGWGFGVRLGPLFVGSNTVVSALLNPLKKADVHLGLKVPLYKKNKKKQERKQQEKEEKKEQKEKEKEEKKERKAKEKQDKKLQKELEEEEDKEQ